ncbi:manganese transporter, putative [Vulcanisaeta moutnovskia 768-28]|uniref:Manganese transporter, putative n=1 Tax=Vulcanisaeta moutnovskia (strain 768-28) TaxID=985053 RepID=F0QW27_VULM7|nr:divalent metal cation transporter [Vulcanisaeta moutnovskia]ADY00951.1 manganese transporter, putative [Vulcanisaeta moutnovskia 768-28]
MNFQERVSRSIKGVSDSLRVLLGPGWLTMLADVDAPSILTAMQSGYYMGLAMVPWLILLTIPLYFIQELTIRAALGSGKGMGTLLKEVYGEKIVAISLIAMLIIDGAAYVSEYAAISAIGLLFGIPVFVSVILILTFHTAIILMGGSYKRVENILLIISAFILVYITAFAVIPVKPQETFDAFLSIFTPSSYINSLYVTLLAANIGAVVMPWMLYYQQSAIVDKGLRREHYTHERFETIMGAIISEVLMIGSLLVGYWLRIKGGVVDGFQSALLSIDKIISPYWFVVAAIGMIAAALLAIFVISLGFAYGLSEYFNWPSGLSKRMCEARGFYAFYVVEVVPAALIIIFMRDLVNLILGIMVFNAIALAIPTYLLISLTSRKDVVGEYAISRARTIVLYVVTTMLVISGIYAAIMAI